MKLALALVVALVAAPALAQTPAPAQPAWPADPSKPVFVVSHIDVTAAFVTATAGALRTYVAAARREPGAVRIEALQEPRPNHFNLVEIWRDWAAYQAHAGAPATIAFHDAIHPWRGSPFEERLGSALAP